MSELLFLQLGKPTQGTPAAIIARAATPGFAAFGDQGYFPRNNKPVVGHNSYRPFAFFAESQELSGVPQP